MQNKSENERRDIIEYCEGQNDSVAKSQFFSTILEEITDKIKQGVSLEGVAFLETFKKLINCVEKQYKHPQKSSRDQDQEISQLSIADEEAKKQLIELKIIFDEKILRCTQLAEEKDKVINEYRNKLELIKRNISKKIKKIIEKSEEKIKMELQTSGHRQKALQTTVDEIEEKLSNFQEFHTSREEKLHFERGNTQAELMALIGKYDTDMSNKQQQFEDLVAQYEREQEMLIKLEENFQEQNEVYLTLMAEKSEYEQAQWDNKLFEIKQKLAARKIQRFVRNYLAKCKTKGKKYGGRKKGKKGTKK